jgi:hypothetical protein
MQKDYLRRKARRNNSSTTSLTSPIDNAGSNAASGSASGPSPTSTKSTSKSKAGWWSGAAGSIKDGSGHEVEQERVILYIHGESITRRTWLPGLGCRLSPMCS